MQLGDPSEVPPLKFGVVEGAQPPTPVAPVDSIDEDELMETAVAESTDVDTAVAAQHRLRNTLLGLARTIRKPQSYVGYSAVVLMCLLKKCQPCMYEGEAHIDLLEAFAPWAKEDFTRKFTVISISVTLIVLAGLEVF